MNAQAILDEIFKTRKVQDAKGNEYALDHNVETDEGEFIMQLIEKYRPKRAIEVGCAYGLSSLFICAALEKLDEGGISHTIIDPGQSKYYNNIGISNLERGGVKFYEFYETVSQIVLPRLLEEGKRFDFGFIDGDHRFEYAFMDFFYLNRLIDVGGIIVMDDCHMESINKVLRYVLTLPFYKPVGRVQIKRTARRDFFDGAVKGPLRLLTGLLPHRLQYELFAGSIIKSDKQLQLDSSMIALQKIKPDERDRNWHEYF